VSDTHPNVALIERLDIHDIAASKDVFAEDAVFRYFNPLLPALQGDYVGLAGIRDFFQRIGALSERTFRIEPVSATAVGNELVVVHTRNSLTFDNQPITMDVVVVWRIVNGRVTEVWDIPSVYTAEQQPG